MNIPYHGNSSIYTYFTFIKVSWKQCSVTKPLPAKKTIPQEFKQGAIHNMLYSKDDKFT